MLVLSVFVAAFLVVGLLLLLLLLVPPVVARHSRLTLPPGFTLPRLVQLQLLVLRKKMVKERRLQSVDGTTAKPPPSIVMVMMMLVVAGVALRCVGRSLARVVRP